MEIKYLNQKEFKVHVKPFLPYIQKLEQAIGLEEGILNVVFVTDAYIQALNKQYRGKDKPTDVLSFNYQQEDAESDLVGEIYVSVETADRQAVEHRHSLSDELIKLIIHGILHVHGYDHEEDEDYKKMYTVEKETLGEIAGPFIEH